MDKQEIIGGLKKLQTRLIEDVLHTYKEQSSSYGRPRFESWQKSVIKFFTQHLPNEIPYFNEKANPTYVVLPRKNSMTDAGYFWKVTGQRMDAYMGNLIIDIKNDEYDFTPINKEVEDVETTPATPKTKSNKVFIVHGHNNEVKERTARFIQKLGFEPIILHEQASGGSTTIIEKILEYAKTTDFAIVLYTADDVGGIKNTEPSDLKPRARQNVVFEHGLLIGLLGRENVVPLVADNIEIPNDISGVVYVRNDWQTAIAKEMKKAGYEIDFNKLF
ncbi:nucleotide-binding protein [Shewanella baltica]|uniref:nucleotide-binding protein n=1 Tax=Shewanella baltica TaxID=62322 RepID=UPI00217EC20D|nr:nucleotide-binding protein [Shewanella baltica]MCS6126715.1 nucleotide-binding protein [Shewanella baltica]MCS6138788.1 nucleotide-binding protein [Shewanella baltica]MCS6144977.1 nucleotide-binding protein [Shewanella baltica]MCS6169507.1 nucleotide-binding protein [Shewanella baltica]MCS6186731.1 nucleotide-binding protein [Shewanella baltica]